MITLPTTLRYNLGNYPVPEYYRGGTMVDIGFNNGSFINAFANFFGRIDGYEPNFYLFNLVKEKYKNFSHISLFNEAVYNKDNVPLKLIKHAGTDDDGSCGIENETTEGEWDKDTVVCECKSVSLATILDRCNGKIDYLKVDCETSEFNLIINQNLSSIRAIAIELHHQLGMIKNNELYQFISHTHTAHSDFRFNPGQNSEYFFERK